MHKPDFSVEAFGIHTEQYKGDNSRGRTNVTVISDCIYIRDAINISSGETCFSSLSIIYYNCIYLNSEHSLSIGLHPELGEARGRDAEV